MDDVGGWGDLAWVAVVLAISAFSAGGQWLRERQRKRDAAQRLAEQQQTGASIGRRPAHPVAMPLHPRERGTAASARPAMSHSAGAPQTIPPPTPTARPAPQTARVRGLVRTEPPRPDRRTGRVAPPPRRQGVTRESAQLRSPSTPRTPPKSSGRKQPRQTEVASSPEHTRIQREALPSAAKKSAARRPKKTRADDGGIIEGDIRESEIRDDIDRIRHPSIADLRRAILMNEILGPPLGLRKPDDAAFG